MIKFHPGRLSIALHVIIKELWIIAVGIDTAKQTYYQSIKKKFEAQFFVRQTFGVS